MDSVARFCVGLGLFAVVFVGCAQESAEKVESPSDVQKLTTLSDTQTQQHDLAIAAKEELFQSLLGELTSSIQENGVPESIGICKAKALELAKAVSENSNLRIGRTSFQLRNPNNTPPSWATSFVEQRVEKEVNIELDNEALGVLLPIRLKDTCLMCHGPKDTLMPEVAAAIRGLYPLDKATGFAAGDLRGYFWVEVPGLSNN